MKIKKISIIVPVYNEHDTIPSMYAKLTKLSLGVPKEIIFINDGSTDGSDVFLNSITKKKHKDIHIINLSKNRGKGYAVMRGLTKATGSHMVIQDADLEYDPEDITKVVNAAEKISYGVIFGSRNLNESNKYLYPIYYNGTKLITRIINILYSCKLTDPFSCQKLVPTDLARKLHMIEPGFGIDTEFTCKVALRRIPIVEVPISYVPRTFSEGKKIRARDGLHVLLLALKIYLGSVFENKQDNFHDHESKSESPKSLMSEAIRLHKDVPVDWYESSIKKNVFQRIWHGVREREIRKYAQPVDGVVLDIGCADGYFSKIILESARAKRLIGIDVLRASIDYARSRYVKNKKMSFRVADAHSLPYKSATFSAVYSIESLEHVLYPTRVIREMRRVLKKNGYVFIIIPSETTLFKIVWYVWTKFRGRVWAGSHVHSFTPGDLPGMLRSAGLRDIQSHSFLFGMLFLVTGCK